MKIRNGFVSNSSSSSFIICCNKSLPIDKIDYVDNLKLLTTKKDLDQYINDLWDFEKPFIKHKEPVSFSTKLKMLNLLNQYTQCLELLNCKSILVYSGEAEQIDLDNLDEYGRIIIQKFLG